MTETTAAASGARAEGPDGRLLTLLLADALSLLDEDRDKARHRIECAYALAQDDPGGEPSRSLLTAWQVARVEVYIGQRLGASLRIEDVSKAVGLSASYFSRAFKATKGVSYSDYVMQARISLAKGLLLTSTPISQIALMCGLADQAHLTRLFSRSEGLPPSAWRRRQLDGSFEANERSTTRPA